MRPVRQTVALFVMIFGLGVAAAPSNAQDALFADAKTTPASIHKVAAGGHWMKGTDEGFFRVVVAAGGVEHVVHRLYIQWIRLDPDTQDYQLARTVSVKELNEGHGSLLDVETEFPDLDRLKITVKASPRGGGPARRSIITVKGVGAYAFR